MHTIDIKTKGGGGRVVDNPSNFKYSFNTLVILKALIILFIYFH